MKMIRPTPITPAHIVSTTVQDEDIPSFATTGPVIIDSESLVYDMAFSPVDDELILATRDAPRLFRVTTDDYVQLSVPVLPSYAYVNEFASTIAYSPDGTELAVVTYHERKLRIYSLDDGTLDREADISAYDSVSNLRWVSGRLFMAASRRRKLWFGPSYEVATFICHESTMALTVVPDVFFWTTNASGTEFVGRSLPGELAGDGVRIDVSTLTQLSAFPVPGGAGYFEAPRPAAWLPDGSALYFVSGEHLYKTSDFTTTSVLYTRVGSLPYLRGVCAAPDSSMISVAAGGTSHIWSTSTDDWVAGTGRADFSTDKWTMIMPFSTSGAVIAYRPKQPDTGGLYALRQTSDWTRIPSGLVNSVLEGDTVAVAGIIYESLIDAPTTPPWVGVASDPPQWLRVGATNTWRCFDQKTGSQTTAFELLEYEISPDEWVTGVALMNCNAAVARVTMSAPGEGVIYDSGERTMYDDSHIVGWFEWFYLEHFPRRDIVFTDLPVWPGATLTVSLYTPAGTVECGEMVLGRVSDIGGTQYGSGVGIIDFSVKEADVFGVYSVIERGYSKRADYDIAIRPGQVAGVHNLLAMYRADPVVWVGDEERPETIVYGYYRDFSITLSTPAWCDCALTVEGI